MKKYNFELTGKLMDGTVIVIDGEYATGSEVYVIDEAGQKAPIFDGDHELESGDVFATVDGKITEVKPKMEDTAVEPQPETELEEVKVEYITKEEFNAFVELFNTFKNEFSKEIFEAMIETKINGLTKVEEATKTEQFNKVEEPKDYKSFILSRIEMIK